MNNESKRERFKRLATKRTNKVLKSLEVLGNCANRSGYDYSEEDIKKIFNAIEGKVEKTKLKFTSGLAENEKRKEFRL